MSLRKEFVLKALGKEAPVTELCREYGVSRKTAYKWIKRFKETGVAGLVSESRRPRRSPKMTREALRAEIIRLRRAHPTWGAKKLRQLLLRSGIDDAPCTKTIERVLKQAGLVRRHKWRPRSVAVPQDSPRVVVDAPNDLWTVDFKGWWQTGDGRRCEPLTVRDAHSRYILALRTLPRSSEAYVRPVFEELFARYGMPTAILSDNGPPFATVLALGGLSRLSAWWIALGINVVRSRPGCPQDNGAHERMHLDIGIELQAAAASSVAAQQAVFDEWVTEFNHVRPHEALRMATPADVYRPSKRKLPAMVIPSYPKHWFVHRVEPTGHITHRRWRTYLSKTLAGHLVAVEEAAELRVWFCNLLLGGYVHQRDKKVSPLLPSAPPVTSPAPFAANADAERASYVDNEFGDRMW